MSLGFYGKPSTSLEINGVREHCVYIYIYIHIKGYIYIGREHMNDYIYPYIYIYIYIYKYAIASQTNGVYTPNVLILYNTRPTFCNYI